MKKRISTGLAVLMLLASSVVCFAGEEKDHICFRRVDADKDGTVTFEEFKQVFGDDKARYDKTDLDRDGKLSHDEYHRSLGHGAS